MSKKAIVFIILALTFAGVIVGYLMYNKPHADILSADPDYSIEVNQLVNEFQNNTDSAQVKFNNSIILVTGTLQEISQTGNSYTLFIGNDPMSGVQASMDSAFMAEFDQSQIAEGQPVKIKGQYTGYDDLFGAVKLNRAFVITESK